MLRTIRRSLETETTHKKEYEQEVETHQSPLQDYFAVQHAGRSVSSRIEETVPIAWAKKKRSFEFFFVLHAIGNPVLGARGNLCLKPVATFCLNVSHLRGMTWPFGPLQNSEWSLGGPFFFGSDWGLWEFWWPNSLRSSEINDDTEKRKVVKIFGHVSPDLTMAVERIKRYQFFLIH